MGIINWKNKAEVVVYQRGYRKWKTSISSIMYYGNCGFCGDLIIGKYPLKRYCDNKCRCNMPEYKKIINKKHKEYLNIPEVKARKKAYSKEYCRKNSEKLSAVARKYYQDNKKDIKIYMRERMREKYRNNPQHRIGIKLRRRVWGALNNYSSTGKIWNAKEYGINYEKIINHLKPFPQNQSNYHIDHIIPLCSFDLNNPEEIKKAFAPENHQWLTAEQNMKKGGIIMV